MLNKIIPLILLCSSPNLVHAAYTSNQHYSVHLYNSVGGGSQISIDKFDTQGGTRRLTHVHLYLDTDQRTELMMENMGGAPGYATTYLSWELSMMAGADIELKKATFDNGGIRFDVTGVGDSNGSSWLNASIPSSVKFRLDSQTKSHLDLFSGSGTLNVWFQGNNFSKVVTSNPDISYQLGDGLSRAYWSLNYQYEQVPQSVSSAPSWGFISVALLLLVARRNNRQHTTK